MADCGIDLGTTNSLIAVFSDDGPKLVPNALGEFLTPSVVGIDESGSMLVGRPASERLVTHAAQTAASFKRLMGTDHLTRLGSHRLRPEELSAFVLRALKADAEAHLGHEVGEAVISVPAYFNDHQRKATLDAGRLAGLKVERLVNEPTAAALAYGLNQAEESKFLVFDLGGGTFDVSILHKYAGVMEVRATAGDTHLGGDDFTAVLEDRLAKRHDLVVTALPPADLARLRRCAEKLKLDLSRAHDAAYALNLGGANFGGTIARAEFEEAAEALLRRLRNPVERVIRDSVLDPHELDSVVLVGGATRMPMVRSLAARLFGRLPLVHINPDETVALGAAVQAGLKARAAALEDVVMTDVCPYTLGIEVIDDPADNALLRVAPIIERNAVVPISRGQRFHTIQDQQTVIHVKVYQGENLRPENNVLLGSIRVGVPPNAKGKEAIEVRFTYDVNGALEVDATVLSTSVSHKEIFRNRTGLSKAELEKRFNALAAIKLHPREEARNRLLLARAERLYEEHRGDTRRAIGELISAFERAILNQRARDLDSVRSAFAADLEAFERGPLDFG